MILNSGGDEVAVSGLELKQVSIKKGIHTLLPAIGSNSLLLRHLHRLFRITAFVACNKPDENKFETKSL